MTIFCSLLSKHVKRRNFVILIYYLVQFVFWSIFFTDSPRIGWHHLKGKILEPGKVTFSWAHPSKNLGQVVVAVAPEEQYPYKWDAIFSLNRYHCSQISKKLYLHFLPRSRIELLKGYIEIILYRWILLGPRPSKCYVFKFHCPCWVSRGAMTPATSSMTESREATKSSKILKYVC